MDDYRSAYILIVAVLESGVEAVRTTWMLWLGEKVMLAGETDGGDAEFWARLYYITSKS